MGIKTQEKPLPVAGGQITRVRGGEGRDRSEGADGGGDERGRPRRRARAGPELREPRLVRPGELSHDGAPVARPGPPEAMPESHDGLGGHGGSPRIWRAARLGRAPYSGSVKLGSAGSVTARSRSQPSFSNFSVWMATALALASSSGSDWNSDTQQR